MPDAGDIFCPAMTGTQSALFPLRLRDVRLSYGGKTVLNGLDLELGATGCTMIMGPNGAGKSLLLKLMHSLIPPDTGTISWNGTQPETVRRRQALVFQTPVLLRRSVAANVDFVLKTRGKDRTRLETLLRHVDLAEKAAQPARLLSGGEKQRLALARALALDPDILLLDEPTASLDPASALMIERIVMQARDRGVRIFFVTHDPGQAKRIGDDVVFLHRGRVVEHGPAPRFFSDPQSGAARAYLNSELIV